MNIADVVLLDTIRNSTKILMISILFFFSNEFRQVVTYFTLKIYRSLSSIIEHIFFTKIIISNPLSIKYIKTAVNKYDLLKATDYEISFDIYNKMEYKIESKVSLDKPYPFRYKDVYFYITEEGDGGKIEIKYFKLFQTKLNIENFLNDCEKIYHSIVDNMDYNDKECICMDFVDKKWMKVQKMNLIDVKNVYYTKDIKYIMDDVDNFINGKKFYMKQNLSYKRCYLVHGPAGTGKTTCAKIIAAKYNYDIFIVSFAQNNITDDDLKKAFHALPPKSIVLFDDFDISFFRNSGEEDRPVIQHIPGNPPIVHRKPLSITTLFNILDGICTRFNCIYFITTNHYDKLIEKADKALFRPGRIDVIQCLNWISIEEIEDFFNHFYLKNFDIIHEHKIKKYAKMFKNKIIELSMKPHEIPITEITEVTEVTEAIETTEVINKNVKNLKENLIKLGLAQLHGHFAKYMTDYRLAYAHVNDLFNKN
jgi:hypothetical protein